MEKVEALNAIDSQTSGSLTDDSVDTASEADKVTYQDLDKAPAPKDLP